MIDPNFNPAEGTASFTTLLVQRDGKVVVGGSFPSLSGAARASIGRFNTDGSQDVPFSPIATGPVFAVQEQSAGRLLVGGMFTAPRSYLVRLLSNGATDGTFTIEASGPTVSTGPGVQAIAVSAEGHIAVGGSFTAVAGATRSNLARLVPAAKAARAAAPQVFSRRGGR